MARAAAAEERSAVVALAGPKAREARPAAAAERSVEMVATAQMAIAAVARVVTARASLN